MLGDHFPETPRLSHPLHFFFFNDTAPPEIYTLSLHDALPIYASVHAADHPVDVADGLRERSALDERSEEHTSELQSHSELVCRLLLEKKNSSLPTPILHLCLRKRIDVPLPETLSLVLPLPPRL